MVVQHVKPWMSEEDIGSGARWNDAIAKALEATDFAIVCVTLENQHAPWLIFEAGAIAKSLDVAHVVPLCIGLAPSQVKGPLEAFQGRSLNKDGLRRLVHDITTVREDPMPKAQVDELFDAMWLKLDAAILRARKALTGPEQRRSADDMLSELVDGVRRIQRRIDVIEAAVVPEELREAPAQDLVSALRDSVELAHTSRHAAETRLAEQHVPGEVGFSPNDH
jgi:hypothetical protein